MIKFVAIFALGASAVLVLDHIHERNRAALAQADRQAFAELEIGESFTHSTGLVVTRER